jgi:nucleoside 2-deoxyribosyltransferase
VKIYLAGPDVFRPDARAWVADARALCRRHGFEPLTPLDHDETEAPRIFQANLDLIRKADIVVANLNAFRGAEPDSGTCCEVGYALALDKRVCGYIDRLEPLRDRLRRQGYTDAAGHCDTQGLTIENFGLPLNLMLAVPARIVAGGLEACLVALRGGADADGQLSPEMNNPRIRQAQEAAIRYLRWVDEGRIADASPIATVAEHYRLRPAAVERWVAAWAAVSLPSRADYEADDVVRQMKISGRQYRSLG